MNSKIRDLFVTRNEPAFRLKQLEEAVYEKSILDIDQITVLSKNLRDEIKNIGGLLSLNLKDKQISSDGTIKCVFELADKNVIETVLMRYKSKMGKVRNTICISSQAGCAMRCSFCATGTMGLKRNLTCDEIVDQVVFFNNLITYKTQITQIFKGANYTKGLQDKRVERIDSNEESENMDSRLHGNDTDHNSKLTPRIDNIVFMGMGEPLNNYPNVMESVKILNEKVGIGARHITVSTCGIVPNILKLADEPFQVNLAISLHSPYDDQRSSIMPINKSFKVQDLMDAVKVYIEKTNRRVSFEYIMLGGVNDSIETAEDLGHMLEPLRLVHVNCIPYNPTFAEDGAVKYAQTSNNQIHRFVDKLKDIGVSATIRQNKGRDIDGACGQLVSKIG
jgi:23S rRNA (adenine2503-C2)-methyltransferase